MHQVIVKPKNSPWCVGDLKRGTYYKYSDMSKPNDHVWLKTQDGATCLETGRHQLFDTFARSKVIVFEKEDKLEIHVGKDNEV